MRIDVKECARLLLEQDDIFNSDPCPPGRGHFGLWLCPLPGAAAKGKFAYVKNEADHSPQVQLSF